MLIKAVIFDFDGVIAETEYLHRQAWVILSRKFNLPLPNDFLDKGIGSTNDKLAAELLAFWQHQIPQNIILDMKCTAFCQLVAAAAQVLVPGVLAALHKFESLGIPMAIATSSPHKEIDAILKRFTMEHLFQSILTLDDVTSPKPAPEVYLRSAKALGQPPHHCLVFEDSILGATAARAAGTNVVAVTTSFPRQALEPVLDAIADFHEIDRVLSHCEFGKNYES